MQEGRANPLQMVPTKESVGKFVELLKRTNVTAAAINGADHHPLNIVQLTRPDRYSRPEGHKGAPLVPQHDPLLDPRMGLDPDAPVVTDEYLDVPTGEYAQSALLAKEAGFDGVDIRSCHRHLLSELLTSHTKEGEYDGNFENRTCSLRQTIRTVHEAVGDDFLIACRLNALDAYPYSYGFGMDQEDTWRFDPTEPVMPVKMLVEEDVDPLSNSAGNPYYTYPQVTRLFDQSGMGIPMLDEHPLESASRLLDFIRHIQEVVRDVSVIGSGCTWLRQYAPCTDTANVADYSCSFMGLGHSSLAYPEAPCDVLTRGEIDPKQCCTTYSKYTQIVRDYGHTGCVIKDSKLYVPLYRETKEEAQQREYSSQ